LVISPPMALFKPIKAIDEISHAPMVRHR